MDLLALQRQQIVYDAAIGASLGCKNEGWRMKLAYPLGLLLLTCHATALGEEPGDANRYVISCQGHVTIGSERPDDESFVWIVDEAAPANEQIFHNGKSVCEGTLSCSVEIKPYQIRVRTVKQGTESGRSFTGEFDGTINRVYGTATVKGSFTETQGGKVKRHDVKGIYACDRRAFSRVI